MKIRFLVASAVLLSTGCWSPGASASETFTCPESITVEEKVNEAFASWEVVQNAQGHHFTQVSFYSGHPRDMASLVPDRQSENSSVWQFSDKASEHFWLACEYTHTEMMLVKQLRTGFSECEVVFAKQLVESITCR